MKALNTNLLLQWSLFASVFIAISLACSTSRSAGSQVQLPDNQQPGQPMSPATPSAIRNTAVCVLKMSEAPVVDGVKLGMTVDEILALFPGSKADSELLSTVSKPAGPLGNSSFVITPSKYVSDKKYKAVDRLSFSMLDGHVSSFTVHYNGPQWPDVDKFIEKFVEDKSLPPAEEWEPYKGMESQMKTLSCDGFSIRIFGGGEASNLNYVLMQDLEADKKLKERRKKAREQASPNPLQ